MCVLSVILKWWKETASFWCWHSFHTEQQKSFNYKLVLIRKKIFSKSFWSPSDLLDLDLSPVENELLQIPQIFALRSDSCLFEGLLNRRTHVQFSGWALTPPVFISQVQDVRQAEGKAIPRDVLKRALQANKCTLLRLNSSSRALPTNASFG